MSLTPQRAEITFPNYVGSDDLKEICDRLENSTILAGKCNTMTGK